MRGEDGNSMLGRSSESYGSEDCRRICFLSMKSNCGWRQGSCFIQKDRSFHTDVSMHLFLSSQRGVDLPWLITVFTFFLSILHK